MDWTIPQAASELKVSEKTVRRWVSRGKVEFERRGGKYGDTVHITRIPEEMLAGKAVTRTERAEMAVQTFADILATKDRRIEELSRELGAARVMVTQLQEQVKLLGQPATVRSWWDRLFRRKPPTP